MRRLLPKAGWELCLVSTAAQASRCGRKLACATNDWVGKMMEDDDRGSCRDN